MVAGLAGDTGKTLVSLGLIGALRARGFAVAPFKKGPDFIDAAWLGAAAKSDGRNLDTFLMPPDAIVRSLAHSARGADLAVVEGNRGLFDGMDAAGTHSTATLCKLTKSPVLLVVDATKSTRTIAALVLGCCRLDPDLQIAAVLLNRVGTSRQESLIRQAVTEETGVPVWGAIPRLSGRRLPSRHLGLVTAVEHPEAKVAIAQAAEAVEQHVDLSAIVDLAREAPELRAEPIPDAPKPEATVRIGVPRDRAFSFYYPENLEALEAAGAELVFFSPLCDERLPDMDALYAGGGFPEVHAAELADNQLLREQLARRIARGLPVWAESGGLVYLSRTLRRGSDEYPMVGALPITVEHDPRPQGHGYVRARVDGPCPFFAEGTELRGHEFHYTRVCDEPSTLDTVLALERGVGVGQARDGIRTGSVVATYTHLHALGMPGWAAAMVRAAQDDASRRAATATSGRAANRPQAPARADEARGGAEAQTEGQSRAVASRAGTDRRTKSRQQRARQLEEAARGLRQGRPHHNGSLRSRIQALIERRQFDDFEKLVAREPRAVRHLLGLTYQTDEELRTAAVRGVAIAGKYHPKHVGKVIQRLLWAIDSQSGTHAATAPAVLQAIAQEQPKLLLPVVPDLLRLTTDDELKDGLSAALQTVARQCPGEVGAELVDVIRDRLSAGGCCHG